MDERRDAVGWQGDGEHVQQRGWQVRALGLWKLADVTLAGERAFATLRAPPSEMPKRNPPTNLLILVRETMEDALQPLALPCHRALETLRVCACSTTASF